MLHFSINWYGRLWLILPLDFGASKVLHLLCISFLGRIVMPTKKPRVNVTFDISMASVLAKLAKKEQKSVASLAKELILEALDRREDMVLSNLADRRDSKSYKNVKHKDAWK